MNLTFDIPGRHNLTANMLFLWILQSFAPSSAMIPEALLCVCTVGAHQDWALQLCILNYCGFVFCFGFKAAVCFYFPTSCQVINQQLTTNKKPYYTSCPLKAAKFILLTVLQPRFGEDWFCCLLFSEGSEMWT